MNTPRKRFKAWLLPVIAACLLLPELGTPVARREQEMRVLLTARDMLQTGRWMEPHFKNEPRLRKPPLMYWLVGGIYATGAVAAGNPVWGRLPSALAGIAFVSVIYGLGRYLVGRRRAYLSALIAAVCVIVLRQARLAETDMTLSLFTTTAALAGAIALRGYSQLWWLLSLIAAGLGFLTKGPAAVALPPAAWLVYAWWRRWRVVSPFRRAGFWAGLAVCVGMALPWYLFIMKNASSAANAQLDAEVSALLTSSKHTGPFFYYVYTVLHAFAPWSLLLPLAAWEGLRHGRHRAGWAFPAAWFATTFVILSCLSSKQIHYSTLLAAPSALLMGCAMASQRTYLRRYAGWLSTGLLWGGLLASLGVLGILAWKVRPLPYVYMGLCALGAAWAASTLIRSLPLDQRPLRMAVLIATLLPGAILYDVVAERKGTAPRDIARWVDYHAEDDAKVACLGPLDTTCAFYANRPAYFYGDLSDAWEKSRPGMFILASWNREEAPDKAKFPAKPVIWLEDPAKLAALFYKADPDRQAHHDHAAHEGH